MLLSIVPFNGWNLDDFYQLSTMTISRNRVMYFSLVKFLAGLWQLINVSAVAGLAMPADTENPRSYSISYSRLFEILL